MTNSAVGIRGIDHVAIMCSDVAKSLTWYEAILGAEMYRDHFGDYWFGHTDEDKAMNRQEQVFLQVGHSRINLVAEDPGLRQFPFMHYAFEIGPNDMPVVVKNLDDHGIPYWGPTTHPRVTAASLYCVDPDGNWVEFTCWDGYPGLEELKNTRNIERPHPDYEWDSDARTARPRENPRAIPSPWQLPTTS